jgi:decaprenylphospho-beta-D-ribofuranose 2-oxidase
MMSKVGALAGYGLYNFSVSRIYRPSSLDELKAAMAECRARGENVVFRGAGRSYGDAALNARGPVIELTGMKEIKSFDEATGVITAEAGATIEDLWRFAIPRGLWPPVVPGTMFPTLGGALAMNIHGKNNWKMGTLGEHVQKLAVLRPDGRVVWIGKDDPELLEAISGWRRPCPIVEVALKLKKVETGYLDVTAIATRNLSDSLTRLDEAKEKYEYLVGWLDAFAGGASMGRGVLHFANVHPAREGEASGLSEAEQLRDIEAGQWLPVPLLLFGLKTMAFDGGMRLVNAAKFAQSRFQGTHTYRQSLVAYSFLLDYIPGWNGIYRPGGFIQYQLFIPKEKAEEVFSHVLRLQQEAGVINYLTVMKRHRPDRFRTTHAVDGFSLAMDFPVTARNSSRLLGLCRAFDALVKDSGGRVYKAKDCVNSVERLAAS